MRGHPLENRSGKRLRAFGSLHAVESMYVCVVKTPRSFPDGWIFPVFEGLFSEGFDVAGLRESSPFPKNLFVKRELAGMDLTSHLHTTKYFSILPMSMCSDCVTTEHPTEISLLIIRKGQSVPAVEIGP